MKEKAKLFSLWIVVLIPISYGIFKTLEKAIDLLF